VARSPRPDSRHCPWNQPCVDGELPYVEPTTDWIRLERRFPVTLVLQDLDPDVVLHMGSDARTLIIY